MVSKFRYIVLLLLILSPAYAQQKQVNFYLDVSPKNGTTDDTYIMSVVIENAGSTAAPILTGGDDFEVQLLGPRKSTTIVNGDVTTETAYNYQLTPKKDGLLDSPAAEAEIDGQPYSAKSIKIKVIKSDHSDPKQAANSGIILKQSIDRTNVYTGEQVRHVLSLYTSVPIYDYSFSDAQFDGFWTQALGDAEKNITSVNGQKYNLFNWSKAIYPLRSGVLEIPEQKMTAKIQVKAPQRNFPFGYNDPFDDPFDSFFGGGKAETKIFNANKLSLNVMPLPPLPPGFINWGVNSVLTGETSIEAIYDKSAVTTGESKTVTVNIRSSGNLNAYDKIPIPDSANYKSYADLPGEKKYDDQGLLHTVKSYKLSVVPLKPGSFSMPPFAIGYFDPKTASYRTASSDKIEFAVTGNDLSEKTAPMQQTMQEIKQTEKIPDSLPSEDNIKYQEDGYLKKLSDQISLSLALFIITALLALVYLLQLIFRYLRVRNLKNSRLFRIKNAPNLMSLSEAYRDYIINKLSLDPEKYRLGDTLRIGIKNNVSDQEIAYRLELIMDKIDNLQFSPEKSADFSLEHFKKEVADTLSLL